MYSQYHRIIARIKGNPLTWKWSVVSTLLMAVLVLLVNIQRESQDHLLQPETNFQLKQQTSETAVIPETDASPKMNFLRNDPFCWEVITGMGLTEFQLKYPQIKKNFELSMDNIGYEIFDDGPTIRYAFLDQILIQSTQGKLYTQNASDREITRYEIGLGPTDLTFPPLKYDHSRVTRYRRWRDLEFGYDLELVEYEDPDTGALMQTRNCASISLRDKARKRAGLPPVSH